MNQKYPIKAFDGTNTADVSVLNLPAGSVGANGEIDLGVGVKVYRALLTQTGTDAPVATVLENTLGGTPVWERSTFGTYTLTLTGAFVGQVVPINTSGKFAGDALSAMVGDRTDDNTYTLYTYYSADLTLVSDDVLFNTYVEIPVYP